MGPKPEIWLYDGISWSQASKYAECPERYRIEKHKVPTATWYATEAGKAIHEITQVIDLAHYSGLDFGVAMELAPDFQALFTERLEKVAARGEEIQASGKKVLEGMTEAGGPNKRDEEWWRTYGPLYIERWVNWREESGYEIATMPDGRPGIEIDFSVELAPGLKFTGSADRVFRYSGDALICFDIKTGQTSSPLQIVGYGWALEKKYNGEIWVPWGMHWQPNAVARSKADIEQAMRIGKPGRVIDLSKWDPDRLVSMYRNARKGIEQGIFVPNTGNNCRYCGVNEYCWAYGGEHADQLPAVSPIVMKSSTETSAA